MTELSAAATHLLLDPKARPAELVKLGVKELVLRKAWSVDRRAKAVRLVPGPPPATSRLPAPLGELDRALRKVVDPAGLEVREAAKLAVRRSPGLVARCARQCERELLAAGLAERRREPFLLVFSRRRLRPTAAGEERVAAVRSGLDRAAAGQLAAAGALVLLLEAQVLEEARRRASDGGGGGGAVASDTDGSAHERRVDDTDPGSDGGDFDAGDFATGDFDLGDLDALDSMGGGDFDGAFDAGTSDGGGGGGDGGGGGGGGGD